MMKLYSGTACPFSHRCRIVLHEKQIPCRVIDVDLLSHPDDLAAVNPYQRVPVLVERGLVLHMPDIINEYLDERFPHPPLMSTEPQIRARARQMLSMIQDELYGQIDVVEKNQKSAEKARAHLRDRLVELSGLLGKQRYVLGNDYSVVDVAMAPLLWRLDHYGIELPKSAAPIVAYAGRLFERRAFIDSLTPTEKTLRKQPT